ncbi:MAG: IPT/TIG domain-containing protein [candidate division KSB1 bacterium]|nr:IPT/TIG domain-containing protein [candidate division KSB1 bacterium]MDZ7300953.1 IPT/TIG domain-containing protein [candidate division KSB1 bacterium]MDZ7310369.1 IPT/TIG domain-containing protein [candidate division KSB1 bacterium]
MRKILIRSPLVVFLSLILVVVVSCRNDYPPSLYNPNEPTGTAPVITSISPTDGALAGVSVVTITGSNFSAKKEENFVWFNNLQAQVLEASVTQLKVKAPVLVGDSIKVKVAVHKVALFSNIMLYKLEPAVAELVKFVAADEPWGIACDAEGNVYASLVSYNVGVGVKKITPAGVISDYAPKGTELKYSALKMGPNGVLYAARIQRVIFQIPAGGGPPAVFVSTGLGTIYDLDFDSAKNIWAGGSNDFIYRVKPDKSVKSFPFKANVRSVRVFKDGGTEYVYLAGNRDGLEKVWRLPIISADEVGAEEEYFNFSAIAAGPAIYAITFAADGDMYLGTDAPEAIFVIHPDKSYEPLYPGLFQPKTLLFAWGKGTELYLTREKTTDAAGKITPQTILRINTKKNGAPYYGRQ